jgi:hypothetical protein
MMKLLLVVEIVVLLGFAVASFRDYQDTWMLEGLEIPFVVMIFTYGAYIFVEKDVKRLLLFSLLFRLAWLVIPQIKYPWFQGVAIDQHTHFGFAKEIHDTGFISSERTYSGTPLMHVFFATYSLITGVSILDSFKYLPILWWGIYPLFIYLLLKKSQLGKNNPSILKYAVVIACIPARTTLSYVVVGAIFGSFLVFLFLYQLVCTLQTNASQYWLLSIICSIALVSAHLYSSTTLLIVFSLTFVVSTFIIRRFRFRYLKATLWAFLAVLNIAWLLYQAPVLYGSAREVFRVFLSSIQGLRLEGGVGTGLGDIRAFELGILGALKTLTVFHGADLFLSLMMMFGILLVVRKFRSSTLFRFVSLYVASAWVYYVAQLLVGRGYTGIVRYHRIFEHTLILSPILGGVALYYLEKKTRSPILVIVTLSLLMILAPVELFHYQPLIPSLSVASELSPSNEPVVRIGIVNSIYQRSLILHAEKYIEKGFIASDIVTSSQILGLTDSDFSKAHLMMYYPFTWLVDNTTKKREYDYFLIHVAGRGGPIYEPAEIRTASVIQTAIYGSSVTYNNGESYVLQKPFRYEG